MAQCPACGKRIPYSLIGSRPTRRNYECKACGVKIEVDWPSYVFRLAEVLTVSGLSVYFSFFYSALGNAVQREAGYLKSSLVLIVLLAVLVLPVDYLVWRHAVILIWLTRNLE